LAEHWDLPNIGIFYSKDVASCSKVCHCQLTCTNYYDCHTIHCFKKLWIFLWFIICDLGSKYHITEVFLNIPKNYIDFFITVRHFRGLFTDFFVTCWTGKFWKTSYIFTETYRDISGQKIYKISVWFGSVKQKSLNWFLKQWFLLQRNRDIMELTTSRWRFSPEKQQTGYPLLLKIQAGD
jgi:hypothetical protein